MARHTPPQMCLSVDEHDSRIVDVSRHYFGCLRGSARRRFYDRLPEKSQRRIRREARRIAELRAEMESQPKTKAGVLLEGFKKSLKDWRQSNEYVFVEEYPSPSTQIGKKRNIDSDVKASMIFFKDSRPYDIPGIENTFPNQKIPVQKLLADEPEENPLMKPCDDNMIRYFHLPANNMIWVEEAMARYYHEKRPDAEDLFLSSRLGRKRTKTEMLLAPEFWLGQQHFNDNSQVHARHMRPHCDVISINQISTEPLPRNLVLFMPYLHWDTDRGRIQSAAAIKEASTAKLSIKEIVERVKNANEQNSQAKRNSKLSDDLSQSPTSNQPKFPATAMEKRKLLGQVWKRAAALMDAIDFLTEEKLILEYLHKKPPLHPRRTLDQSYYGALKDTATRDRDQVVYRETRPVSHKCVDHIDTDDKWQKCRKCQEDIHKIPRLIMVDQLWLWILDEKTVITSFPRRWGKIRPDPSAVHKSLRMRLKTARQDEIRSAYDLALIIIDECSRVFFDRTKAEDRLPNLVDMFADAIGQVTYRQTAAFDQFLIYTHLASKDYNKRDRDRARSNAMQNTLLCVNPEGNLFKEIKDILDEIHILTRVKLQQQTVATTFVKHIKQFLLPELRTGAAWHPVIGLYEDEHSDDGSYGGQKERRDAARLTIARADHLLDDIRDRMAELKILEDNARKTATSLKDILALKQQQAGVIEAREAVQQANETLEQGKSIMLFTVVTIVFLPLSFGTSVFGMNTSEFNNGLWTLSQQITYILPISAGIIIISFLLAFTHSTILSSFFALLRNLLVFPFNIARTWLLTRSRLYPLSRKMATKANALKEEENSRTAVMKANVLRENVELKEMREIYAPPGLVAGAALKTSSRDGSDDEEAGAKRTPRVGGLVSRMTTPRLGSGGRFGSKAGLDDDVERVGSSRSGSRVRLMAK